MPYIDPSVVAQVKQIDLLTYLQEREPDELVRIGPSTYATKTHDSLKISNGKWYWWSRGFGGRSALDYLVKVRDMRFVDAVEHLASSRAAPSAASPRTERPEKREFRLPPRHGDSSRVASYLESRGIAPQIVEDCVRRGLIYEYRHSSLSNAVFVGRDGAGAPRYAALRGCKGNFKGEASGSDKRFAFKLAGNPRNPEVHVFEAAIDALCFATILHLQGLNWRSENLLSLGGVPPASAHPGKQSAPAALVQHLADNPDTKTIRLHLDNDPAGLNAATLIAAIFGGKYDVRIEPPESGKDMNEYLLTRVHRPRNASKGRER